MLKGGNYVKIALPPFFHFIVDPFLEGTSGAVRQTGSQKKFSPFVENSQNLPNASVLMNRLGNNEHIFFPITFTVTCKLNVI